MSAAATVFLRRYSAVLSSSLWHRSLSTQTQRSQQAKAQQQFPPQLLLSSPEKPESRYLYDLTSKDDNFIRFHSELHLPAIAGQHFIGSSQGIVLSLDEDTADIHAIDPLTGATLRLPSTVALPNMAGVIRDPDGRLIHYVSSRKHSNEEEEDDDGEGPEAPKIESFILEDRKTKSKTLFSKFSKSSDRLVRIHPLQGTMAHWYTRAILSPSLDAVIVIYGSDPQQIAFSRLRSSIKAPSWTSLGLHDFGFHDYEIHDIIFHDGRLHAIDLQGSLTIFDLDKLHPVRPHFCLLDGPIQEVAGARRSIVESPDGKDLFVVFRDLTEHSMEEPCRTRYFKLYKLNKTTYKWKRVKSIGDIAIFLGSNHSFSLSVHDFPSLKSNSIYFTDDYKLGYLGKPDRVVDTGVYNLEDESCAYIELSDGPRKLNYPAPIWFMPTASTAR